MTEPACRPFRMSDAMILIAATAVGMAEARVTSREISESGRGFWITSGIILTTTLLPAWSVGFVAIRLQMPRPSRDRFWIQPGALACFAGGISSSSIHLLLVAKATAPGGLGAFGMSILGASLGSIAVSYFWSLMKLTGRWKPEPGWIDRCGIILGFSWISILVAPGCLFGFLLL